MTVTVTPGYSAERMQALIRFTHEAIAVLDGDGRILYATRAAGEMFGYGVGSKAGVSVLDLLHADDRAEADRLIAGGALSDGILAGEFRIAHADGSWRYVKLTWSDVSEDDSVEGATVVNLEDVTHRRNAELLVQELQFHDPLTGLSTRPVFIEQLVRAAALAKHSGWQTGVFSLDIDHFHRLNEEYGQSAGDLVLVIVAHRLRACLRQHDTTARAGDAITRAGSDKFLLMCENVGDEGAALAVAHRISAALAEPMIVEGASVSVVVSIGIAICSGDVDPVQAIGDAEAGRHHAKSLGEGHQQFFTTELQERALAATSLIEDLREGLARNEFRLVYQPKVALDTNRIVGVESLLRWDHPTRGLVPPDEFIPVAESSGFIVALGEWVLRESCRQAGEWRRAFPRLSLRVAVNVSACQFRSGFSSVVAAVLSESGCEASTICLEMTETTLMDDITATIGVLDELKAIGVTVSIDDFGTGYSSLEYLHRMPIDEVKVDRTFVAGLGRDAENTAIVASVISLAHAMDLEVVAEGVETPEQLARLRSLGCDFAQGYFFAKPMPPRDLVEILAADATGAELPLDASWKGHARPSIQESVLLVDDTAAVRMLAKMTLASAGFDVEEAENGAAAIALARRLRPTCVLLDVSMPDMSGVEVLRTLRNDPATAGCTIVMLTTHEDATDKAEAFLAGADDYMVKPFTPRDLVARIRSAINRRRTAVATVGGQVEALLLAMLEEARVVERSRVGVPDANLLSTRQIEILKRLVEGERVPGIARDLNLSQSTVRNHLSSIYRRFGVHSQEELLAELRRASSSPGRIPTTSLLK